MTKYEKVLRRVADSMKDAINTVIPPRIVEPKPVKVNEEKPAPKKKNLEKKAEEVKEIKKEKETEEISKD